MRKNINLTCSGVGEWLGDNVQSINCRRKKAKGPLGFEPTPRALQVKRLTITATAPNLGGGLKIPVYREQQRLGRTAESVRATVFGFLV